MESLLEWIKFLVFYAILIFQPKAYKILQKVLSNNNSDGEILR